MATSSARLKPRDLAVENVNLTAQVFNLQNRLESVADILIKHGFIHNTPHARYKFVHGEDSQEPVRYTEFVDIDGLKSKCS